MTDTPEGAERAVAIAMFIETGDGSDGAETFDTQPAEDREEMLRAATLAMVAHVDWLKANGFRIVPPGMTLMPQSEEEASAMLVGVTEWRRQAARNVSRKRVVANKPQLIVPPGVKLQ